ncbi:MAG: vWA domain-containing protein [Thermodesulfobacteriota bacterium]
MFVDFFYMLKKVGIPVTPTSFLRLHAALKKGLINSIDDFYVGARTILIKSERYFDLYDQVFAHRFHGIEFKDPDELELTEVARAMLEEWLKDPQGLARVLGVSEEQLLKLAPDELLKYFLDRLKEQTEAHHGGNRWIGTRGTSPVGHSGYHPGGMRVGGASGNKSAVKIAMERRYRDYSQEGPLTESQMGEALKRLRNLVPVGPKDQVNIDKTIYATMKHGGEIEIVFDRSMRDRLKVVLAIDNGGWSMDPYIDLVQTLFNYARAQFKDLKTFFFHNTIYDYLWEDPPRRHKPYPVDQLIHLDPETRFVIVGDASMAPYELMARDGSIYVEERSGKPSIERLKFIAATFKHAIWINPRLADEWPHTPTINYIREIFPMFELTLNGLEKAVSHMMLKH